MQATSFDVPDLGQQSHILQGLRDAGKTLDSLINDSNEAWDWRSLCLSRFQIVGDVC